MHKTDLRQIHDIYDHVYLSPHLDDAALSCGGAIARHTIAGSRVLVVTICTAMPPDITKLSSFAEQTHQMWGFSSEEIISARQREDGIAMEHLAADSMWAGMLDAIYRKPDVYTDNTALFGEPVANDPLFTSLKVFLRALRGRVPRATMYAPLGVGSHVDHQITYAAARAAIGSSLAFYEDFPYVSRPNLLEERLSKLEGPFVSSTINIDSTLSRKIGAISAYKSQIESLFGSMDEMSQQVRAYAETLVPEEGTYGERLWLLNTQ
jgi:LmbE family N-acetylglucosaminyl deacetylase